MNSALQLRLLKDFGIKELTSFQQRVNELNEIIFILKFVKLLAGF